MPVLFSKPPTPPPPAPGALYGPQSNVNRCYDNEDPTVGVSELCKRWFIAESCLYECDVSVGKYRRYDDCEPLHW